MRFVDNKHKDMAEVRDQDNGELLGFMNPVELVEGQDRLIVQVFDEDMPLKAPKNNMDGVSCSPSTKRFVFKKNPLNWRGEHIRLGLVISKEKWDQLILSQKQEYEPWSDKKVK